MDNYKYEKVVSILVEKIEMLETCYKHASGERDALKAENEHLLQLLMRYEAENMEVE